MVFDPRLSKRRSLKYFGALGGGLVVGCGEDATTREQSLQVPSDIMLRIASFNIANARGNTDELFFKPPEEVVREHLDEIVAMLEREQIDIACLNEVDYDSNRTYGIDQAEYIARALGFGHVAKEVSFEGGSTLTFGNAIVSRFPVEVQHTQHYAPTAAEQLKHSFKSFVDCNVLLDDYTLSLVLTHLESRSSEVRLEEVPVLLDYVEQTRPHLLLGDLNSEPGKPAFERLTGSGLLHNPYVGLPSYPSDAPRRAIDHIWVVDPAQEVMAITDYHTRSIPASDHAAVIAEVRITDLRRLEKLI